MTQDGSARIRVGDRSPVVALPDQYGRVVPRGGVDGRPVLVVFFPFAFSPTCSGELAALRGDLPEIERAGADLVAISCDSVASLRAWDDAERFGFPLLSDFWPHGAVAESFGVLGERGHPGRSTFGIDRRGVVRAAFASLLGEPRPRAAYTDALARITATRDSPDDFLGTGQSS